MCEVLDDEQLQLLTHAERLGYLVEQDRIIAAAQAEQLRVLALMHDDPPDAALPGCEDKNWLAEEVACSLNIAPTTAASRLAEASVSARLPGAIRGMSTGKLSGHYVQALTRRVLGLDPEVAGELATRVLPSAPGRRYGEFCRYVDRELLKLAPPEEEAARATALQGRRVSFWPDGPGTTGMYAVLPDEDAAAVRSVLRDAAKRAATDGDDRTVDQRRADVLVDLVLGSAGHDGSDGERLPAAKPETRRRHPLIQVTVALSTLLGLDDRPADLDGIGPIPAPLARRLAHDSTGTWRRIVTDPTGQLVDYGRTTYEPPAPLADHVNARDRTCRFPGCNRTARSSELDHRLAWADGGETNAANLHVLCPRHHHLKHETRWRHRRLANHSTEWRSPSGVHYAKPPPDPYPVDGTSTGRDP